MTIHATAQTLSGSIKVGKVDGTEVYRVTPAGQSTALKAGDLVEPADTITTGKTSSVVLVFMNGSSVRVGNDSKLLIEQFLMDPLNDDIVVSKLASEPSVSQTTLSLAYGEVVGDVKKLNKSSSFSIKTPIGAAGIRGTIFRIVFRPTGDGRTYYFQLATKEGLVVFEGTLEGLDPKFVGEGQEFTIVAEIDPATGQLVIRAMPTAGDISGDAIQGIEDAINQAITQAEQTTVFPGNRPEENPTPPPPPTQRPDQLTPGAGG